MERLVYNQWHVSKCQNCSHLLCTYNSLRNNKLATAVYLKASWKKKKNRWEKIWWKLKHGGWYTKQIPHRIYSKKQFYRREPDHTIVHAQWSHPQRHSFEGTYLLAAQRLWALDRTAFRYPGLQRLWGRQKESEGEREQDQITLRFQMQSVYSKVFPEQREVLWILPRRWNRDTSQMDTDG